MRLAMLLTADRHRAEDLLQQTLERLAKRWRRVDDPGAYCRTVLVNLATDAWRARRRRPEAPLEAAPELGAESYAFATVDLRLGLLAALRTLTPRQRAVLVLRYFDDRSEAEAALLLRVSVGTVKSTASRTLTQLRGMPALQELFHPAAHQTTSRSHL